MTDADDSQPTGPLEFRVAQLANVDYPERVIELIVMPYESETLVAHEGRMIQEVCSRGAFDGIERRANRIRVNRDHDVRRTVGRAIALHPSRAEGLVAELRIARTELGDETLALAEDDCLDASAGFLPMANGQVWETRSRRRLTKVWLGHIAMTPDPAYVSAKVLAVRSNETTQDVRTPTPNLDAVRAWRLQDWYNRLNR